MQRHLLSIPHIFFLVLAGGVLLLFWKIISPFALVLVTAGIFAIVLSPIARRLEKRIANQRTASLLMVLGVFLIVLVPLFFVSLAMVEQGTDLVQRSFGIEGWVHTIDLTQNPLFLKLPSTVQQDLRSTDVSALVKNVATFALENMAQLFASTARLVFNTFLFFVSLFYILAERDRIYAEILALSPLKDSVDKSILYKIVQTVRAVVFGSLIVALIQAVIATIGMTIFGVPGALIWGSLIIIAAQVPMLGVGVVMIPVVTYLFLTGETGSGVGLLIWSLTAVGLVDNLLQPVLIQGKTQMHALLILISILGGLQLFGPIGLILGPTVLAALLVILQLYKSGILER